MTARRFGSSLCWECGKKLRTRKGGGYAYRVVKDPMNHQHRVHKLFCFDEALARGCKAADVVIAQENPNG